MPERYRLFIDNNWEDPRSGQWFDTEDPFSGKIWAEIPRANAEDVDRAVKAAKAAMTGPWGTISATDRGMLLFRLGQLIEENAAALAEVEARDNGKVLSEVAGQIHYVAKYFFYYAGLADKIEGSVIPIDKPRVFNYTRFEPMGVVASITPGILPFSLLPGRWRPPCAQETRSFLNHRNLRLRPCLSWPSW